MRIWRNNTDGNYHSDHVLFFRTEDGGAIWSAVLDNGKIMIMLRSNYTNSVGVSWSRVKLLWIPYLGATAPAIIRTSDNILVLATRMWGIITSIDGGHAWGLPMHNWPLHG